MNAHDYVAFVATVKHGSITAAAAELGLSRPTLSRQLAALEQDLGLALLHRSTRKVLPTPAGQQLYEQVQPVLADLARVEARLREERDEVAGLLRVSVPPVIAPDIARLLVRMMLDHPALRVELLADVRPADLRADGVEVAVRAGRLVDPDLVQRRLGVSDVSAVASPAYLDRAGRPDRPEALAQHRLLLGQGPDDRPHRWWPLRDGGRVPVDGAFSSNDQHALTEAALCGAGIALCSEVSAAPALQDGRLQRVLAAEVGTELKLHAIFARRTLQPARVRVFVEALVGWFGEGLELDVAQTGLTDQTPSPPA